MITILDPQLSFSSQVTRPNQVYVIIGEMSLNQTSFVMPGWLGECKDIWFNYSESSSDHFSIVNSVCQFEICTFTNRKYSINTWETIYLRPLGCVINGGNATFFITQNKGSTTSGWHDIPQYSTFSLFEKKTDSLNFAPHEEAGILSISDLTIFSIQEVNGSMLTDPLFNF